MSLVATLSYIEGKCLCPKIHIVIGFLPKAGPTLVAISNNGIVGFTAVTDGKKLELLKTGLQLKMRDRSSIAYSKTLKQFVAVGGDNSIARSSDSLVWKYIENPNAKNLKKVVWNETLGHYIAVGIASLILVSRDGKEWQASEAKSNVNLNDILWCPIKHHYILIGDAGYIALSNNGINWQVQTNSANNNLIGIASTGQWDDKVSYLVITQKDEIIESTDGKKWSPPLKQPANIKEMRAIYYNHIYGNVVSKEKGIYRFFSIMTSDISVGNKGIFRGYQYYNSESTNSTYKKSVWFKNTNYIRNSSAQISDIKQVQWFDEINLFIAIAANPVIFFQNGYSDSTWVWDSMEVETDFLELIKLGFSDVTLASIPEFKDNENTLYYNLEQYS